MMSNSIDEHDNIINELIHLVHILLSNYPSPIFIGNDYNPLVSLSDKTWEILLNHDLILTHRLLHYAIRNYDCKTVRLILERIGESIIEEEDEDDFVCDAVEQNNPELVRLLLENLFSVENKGYLLHKAVKVNNPEIVRLLLEHGANIEATNRADNKTPLHVAVMQNSVEIVQLLLERGANVNAQCEYGTPLKIAMYQTTNSAIVRLLLQYGADCKINKTLFYAIDEADNELLQMLLKRGADVETTNGDGETPLVHAVFKQQGSPDNIILTLLQHGADVEATDEYYGETPLHYAATLGMQRYSTVRLLLEHGAKVDPTNDFGYTPLCELNDANMANVLLQHGANVKHKNKHGSTALHRVIAMTRSEPVLRLLIQHGADINAQDEDGNTPLHVAADYHSKELVRMLLGLGADATIKNNKGETAADFAPKIFQKKSVRAVCLA